MGHTINKQFDFCYGHRVWSQKLIEGYVEDMCLKCRHLHGHQGKILVHLEPIENPNALVDGMVTDFKHLGWFKKWLDDTFDHKFIMDRNDPLFNHEIPHFQTGKARIIWENGIGLIDMSNLPEDLDPAIIEKYEGMVFVNFVPTSENLSKFFCEIINTKMLSIGVRCSKIEFNETPKSQAVFKS